MLAAKRVIQHLGGKLSLFQSSLPSLGLLQNYRLDVEHVLILGLLFSAGEGALKMRENPRLLGTDREHTLLNPEEQ